MLNKIEIRNLDGKLIDEVYLYQEIDIKLFFQELETKNKIIIEGYEIKSLGKSKKILIICDLTKVIIDILEVEIQLNYKL